MNHAFRFGCAFTLSVVLATPQSRAEWSMGSLNPFSGDSSATSAADKKARTSFNRKTGARKSSSKKTSGDKGWLAKTTDALSPWDKDKKKKSRTTAAADRNTTPVRKTSKKRVNWFGNWFSSTNKN